MIIVFASFWEWKDEIGEEARRKAEEDELKFFD